MDFIPTLSDLYDKLGILGFFAVLIGAVLMFFMAQQSFFIRRLLAKYDDLLKENRRLNDQLVGLNAFIQSFLSVIIEHEEVVKAINTKIRKRLESSKESSRERETR